VVHMGACAGKHLMHVASKSAVAEAGLHGLLAAVQLLTSSPLQMYRLKSG
jgi:hypothetical protein